MSEYPQLIDNNRRSLKEVLSDIISSGQHHHLSIATGYWDLPGMEGIIDNLESFESIRLLIGQEPLPEHLQRTFKFDVDNPESLFPDKDFTDDLERLGKVSDKEKVSRLREIATKLAALLKSGILEVKVFRKPRLHAKAYIFGDANSSKAVGIIGSSNFTRAGLNSNAELNYLQDDPRQILFQPQNITQEHSHLSWFDELWNDPEALEWTGEFGEIIEKSPVGAMTYGPYDVYIKTLMEVFPDELLPPQELSQDTRDVLYSFQKRNAGILLNKLQKMGVAMLSDSVGLGKTITAGAVIKHYLEMSAKRILVIAPPGLEQQWNDDLRQIFGLTDKDFSFVSMKNRLAHEQLAEDMKSPSTNAVDLFIIDEAHNLRNPNGVYYQSVLKLLESSPQAPVLLLTATPVNNSLMDFANQIQLGLRDSMVSVPVQIKDSNNEVQMKDFIEALHEIQSKATAAEKAGRKFNWDTYSSTLKSGLGHYLVRSTRQGVEQEGSLIKDGLAQRFPRTRVEQLPYTYDQSLIDRLHAECSKKIDSVFNGIDPLRLNLNIVSEVTQQTLHPIDLYAASFEGEEKNEALDTLDDKDARALFTEERSASFISGVFQLINFLGFAPYRTDLYRHHYYGKTQQQLQETSAAEEELKRVRTQRTIHNILHVTWLKRLESSAAALLKSVEHYEKRLDLFEKYLDKGYVVNLSDITELESEYGEDLERAFGDYENTFKTMQEALEEGRDTTGLELKGVERKEATEQDYKLRELKTDIERDRAIAHLLHHVLKEAQDPLKNGKLNSFAEEIKELLQSSEHGKKILVFSFFADTINYLKDNLPGLMLDIPDFEAKSAYLTGSDASKTEDVTQRFAPKAKKYEIAKNEQKIDFLFATDVLSEGQNLQDAGILINFDLHWNPVRMIQRNGRINRLGSDFDNVLIVNMKPDADLELYLKLVKRLERKIDTIKNSIGTDQSVLGEEENPIEFAEFFSDDSDKASQAADRISKTSRALDVFDATDEYVYDLRKFLADHKNDGAIDRIKAIPNGKWNYLPQRTVELLSTPTSSPQIKTLPPEMIIVLEKAVGASAVSNKPFTTTLFVQVEAVKRYIASAVETADALRLIKTSPDDNTPQRDTIPHTIDRAQVNRRAKKVAETRMESDSASITPGITLTPAQHSALTIMSKHWIETDDLLTLVQAGITKASDHKEFKELARKINNESRDSGSVTAPTKEAFLRMMRRLQGSINQEHDTHTIESILFYAPRR